MFDKCMHCEMITIVITIITDISITSNSYVLNFFLWREHLRSTVLANFKYTLLLNVITILYIRPLELTHTIRESLHHLLNIPHYSHPWTSNHHFILCYDDSDFLCFLFHIWDYMIFLYLCLTYLMSSRSIHFITNGKISLFF